MLPVSDTYLTFHIPQIGIGASNTRLRKQAESISDAVQEGSICAVECWDQAAGCAHNFFLCEVRKHPDESIKKTALSQVGKKKHTDNGPLSQPIRMHDPLFAAQLLTPDPDNDTAAGLAYVKHDKVVLINGRGFRYHIKTGDIRSVAPPAPPPARQLRRRALEQAVTPADVYRLQPATQEGIKQSLYAQSS